MKNRLLRNHVLRPLMVVVVLVIILVVVRQIYVPGDFGVHGGFTYNYYREADIQEWQNVTVKYQGKPYCGGCHQEKVELIGATPHAIIQCENCHGPGLGHPETVRLAIGDSQKLCLRCHVYLPYAASGRSNIVGIDPNAHGLPGLTCVDCHNPHQPTPLPTDNGGPSTTETNVVDGEALFAANCSGCHGTGGVQIGSSLTSSQILSKIATGSMSSYASSLNDAQREALADYVAATY